MKPRAFWPLSVGLLAAALVGSDARGEEQGTSGRLPSPVKALQSAASKLVKSESYRTKVSIEGGWSESEDHKVSEAVVREVYDGEVFGSLMHVPKIKAYRFPKKGVAYVDGAWRNILSDLRTMRLDRLFTFPEVVLGRALTHAPKSARWLTPEEEKALGLDSSAEDEDESDDSDPEDAPKAADKKKDDGKPSGKTEVVKTKAGAGKNASGPRPRVVRIEAPPKEALTHFTEVQNSGCMSAG